jgi:hypothetical protein
MSRLYSLTACSAVIAAVGFLLFTATGARADSMADNINVNGSYHSVTNGIPDYEGFDRFRDANGNPLPGWEQQLRTPG